MYNLLQRGYLSVVPSFGRKMFSQRFHGKRHLTNPKQTFSRRILLKENGNFHHRFGTESGVAGWRWYPAVKVKVTLGHKAGHDV